MCEYVGICAGYVAKVIEVESGQTIALAKWDVGSGRWVTTQGADVAFAMNSQGGPGPGPLGGLLVMDAIALANGVEPGQVKLPHELHTRSDGSPVRWTKKG